MAELDKIGLIGTMKRFAGFPDLLANPRMFTEYPAMKRDVLKGAYTVDGRVPDTGLFLARARTSALHTVRNAVDTDTISLRRCNGQSALFAECARHRSPH